MRAFMGSFFQRLIRHFVSGMIPVDGMPWRDSSDPAQRSIKGLQEPQPTQGERGPQQQPVRWANFR